MPNTCAYDENEQLIEEYIECVFDEVNDSIVSDVDMFFLLVSGVFIFFMQTGFAMLCAGSVRQKNVQNVLFKNFIDLCFCAISFYCLGFGFAFGNGSSFIGGIGRSGFALQKNNQYAFYFIQFCFAGTADTVIAGTVAERCQIKAYICYSIFLGSFVYPVIARSVWYENGFLLKVHEIGAYDFAGSGVVHITGGATALIAAISLGPRKGRFYDFNGKPFDIPVSLPASSATLRVLGTFLLWIGWYGFNFGSTLKVSDGKSHIAAYCTVTTTLAAASGGMTSMFLKTIIEKRKNKKILYDLDYALNGALGGLVAICAGSAVIEPPLSIVVGIVAGLIYCGSSSLLVKYKIDDVVDAIPVHLFCGIWGVLSVGLLASSNRLEIVTPNSTSPGLFYGGGLRLLCQIYLVLWIVGWVSITMIPFFLLLRHLNWLRIDELEEKAGTDMLYHGNGGAYNLDGPKREHIDEWEKRKEVHFISDKDL
eukprot:CAMPEP_0194291848 /NCGR_PEP_ID=MMETSP0169-20130528/44338_1 /TAXON_ID=218684 /ORGANISM="Corethron pennatum, Strain L29A3" /LENGTH=478 /DNA_ID=CAMNT_0039039851 /DNA_START=5 /DNA_END=1444 /DNA_ORIENTATION=+